jgi:hypothetical protein
LSGLDSEGRNYAEQLIVHACHTTLLILALNIVAFADEPPAWLKQTATTSLPTYGKDVHAVVLHDESRKTIEDDGKIKTTSWWAVKILSREGRGHARASESYNTGSSKVKEMRAWLIRPNGQTISYGKKKPWTWRWPTTMFTTIRA